jgi:hypothetical protein
MSPKEIWDGMDWIHLAQDRDKWCGLVNTVINLTITLNTKNLAIKKPIAFQGLCSMQLVIELCQNCV